MVFSLSWLAWLVLLSNSLFAVAFCRVFSARLCGIRSRFMSVTSVSRSPAMDGQKIQNQQTQAKAKAEEKQQAARRVEEEKQRAAQEAQCAQKQAQNGKGGN